MKLLDDATRRLLDRLRLFVPASATAARQGGHRSPILASGLEFADHRHYVPGDDVRQIDWKAFARHRQLVVRQFEEERDARVYILCDVSSSMGRGEPPKVDVGRRLSAAFSYLAMKQFDAAQVIPFADDVTDISGKFTNRAQLPQLERFLGALDQDGLTVFPEVVRSFGKRFRSRGLVFVVSDLMTPDGWDEGLRILAGLGHRVTVVRVTCAEDDRPSFRGELSLIDSESGERVRVRMSKDLIEAYRQVVGEHVDGIRKSVRRLGGRFVEADVSIPTNELVRTAVGLHSVGTTGRGAQR